MAVPPIAAPRRGAEHPRVVVQVFSDFECPYCARAEPTLNQLLAEFGPCVQIVWRNRPMPYHEHAELAARAALEVYEQRGAAAFWRYHGLVFASQDRLSRSLLEAHARSIEGIDMAAFRAALDSGKHHDVIERDIADVDRIEPRYGTPTFFVNGVALHGARPYDVFRAAVEDALLALERRPSD
jgi:protein-disulfide isomerase